MKKRITDSRTFQYTETQKRALALIGSDAENIMLFGGAGSGKTFILVSFIALVVHMFPGIRIAILRKQLKDVRESVMLETFPDVMRLHYGWKKWETEARINKADYCYRTDQGSELWFGGIDDNARMDNILGKEYALIYFNECSQISYKAYQTAIGRLRQHIDGWRNRAFFDCNPPSKMHWVYNVFIEGVTPDRVKLPNPDDYAVLKMNPSDNEENLPPGYIEKRLATMTGREYKRFYLGEFTDDSENALWKRKIIDPFRLEEVPEGIERIVIGVDPAVTANEKSDLTGIVVCGAWESSDGQVHFCVLEDQSGRYTPKEWTAVVRHLYGKWNANEVVAEVNQGGLLVTEALRNANANLPIRAVRASNGKIARAEPIVVLYEQGRVHHVGEFPDLEDEMTSFTGTVGEKSPDRMDALVWALTALTDKTEVSGGNVWFG